MRAKIALIAAGGLLVAPASWSQSPAWWKERQVVSEGQTADHYLAVNEGQLKNIAVKAFEELAVRVPMYLQQGSEYAALWQFIEGIVSSGAGESSTYAMNQGQAKNVASKFYSYLVHLGVVTQAPWSGAVAAPDHQALVNQGQIKNLFSFDLARDEDGDGIPGWLETRVGLDPNDSDQNDNGVRDGDDDWDGDHLSNSDEAFSGTNINASANVAPDDADGDGKSLANEVTAGLNPAWKDHPGVLLQLHVSPGTSIRRVRP